MALPNGRHRVDFDEPKVRKERKIEISRYFTSSKRLLLLVTTVMIMALQVSRGIVEVRHVGSEGSRVQPTLEANSARSAVSRSPSNWKPRQLTWQAALQMMRRSQRKYVVVNVKNGLGNRLRAMASARAVAASLSRPMLLLWQPDLHCNCSFESLFRPTDSMVTILEEEIPQVSGSTIRCRRSLVPIHLPQRACLQVAEPLTLCAD